MIPGTVSTDGIPVISLPLAGKQWEAIVDTGFNGDLELPEKVKPSLNTLYVGRVTSTLGGGYTIEEDVYLVDIQFEDEVKTAEVTFVSSSHILIGTQLLKKHSLYINFDSKVVELNKIQE